jgi:DNA repair protein RecO (recombination protein O)
MSATLTDYAIVLSREAWREADKRVVFFTQHHGKIDGIAIGAHKIRSKLAGHLEPLRIAQVMLAKGKQGYKVAQCVTQHNFIRTDAVLERTKMMGALVRLARRATENEHKDEDLYSLLSGGLGNLESAAAQELPRVYGNCLLDLAHHFGYAPMLGQCVVCGDEQNLLRFSPHLGGVICAKEVVLEKTMPYKADDALLHTYVGALLTWRGLF